MPTTKPFPCSHSVMAQRGTSEVVLLDIGNYGGASNFLNQTWKWSGPDWVRVGGGTIDTAGPLPLRANFAMSYDGYNVVMFGGQGESSTSGMLSDTWTWNGTAWTKEAPATVPFGRFKSEIAFIGAAGANKCVMFGGSNQLNFLNDTWIWNGSAKTWTLTAQATSPSARVDHMFGGGPTFCVLFGGKNANSLMNDTWKFDGTSWTLLTPTNAPSVRAEAAFNFDGANNQWVMFGGRNEFGLLAPETWLLNSTGTTWTKAAPATSPSGRVGAQMCFDTNTGKMLMFGGNDANGNTYQDTWTWNGTVWTQI